MYERKPEDMISLKFKVGDKVMGYSRGLGLGMLVGGVITKCEQSKSHLNDNKYLVLLEPEVNPTEAYEGARNTGDWWIDEKQCVPFEQDRWNRAVLHWKVRTKAFRDAQENYVRMLMTLYPEEYTESK